MTPSYIERLLTDAGVSEGREFPYLTTARTLFAYAASRAVNLSRSTRDVDDELLEHGRAFIENFWKLAVPTSFGCRLRLFRQYGASVGSHGGIALMDGMAHLAGAVIMPSVMRDRPTTRLSDEDVESARRRATHISQRMLAKLRAELPEDVEIRRTTRMPLRRWTALALEMVVDGNTWHVAQWSTAELFHRSDAYLMSKCEDVAHGLAESGRRLELYRKVRPDILGQIAEANARKKLPLTFRLGRDPSMPSEGEAGALLLVDGYGPGGEPAVLRTISLNDKVGHWQSDAVVNLLYNQELLHEIHGPVPRMTDRWTIDAVTARLIADDPERGEAIRLAIGSGEARMTSGAKLRIDGRHHLSGSVNITETAKWDGDRLRILDVRLPETVMTAAAGMDVSAIVDDPRLADAGVIVKASMDRLRGKDRLTLAVEPRIVTLDR